MAVTEHGHQLGRRIGGIALPGHRQLLLGNIFTTQLLEGTIVGQNAGVDGCAVRTIFPAGVRAANMPAAQAIVVTATSIAATAPE